MVSTWLDPNFFGAFLALVLLYVAKDSHGMFFCSNFSCKFLHSSLRPRLTSQKTAWLPFQTSPHRLAFAAVLLVALAFTQSRSSIIALMAALIAFSPLILIRLSRSVSPALIVRGVGIAGLMLVWLAVAGLLLGPRAVGVLSYDPTVDLRSQALQSAWFYLVEPNAVFGVGYNTYQFAAVDAGLISDFAIHSRAGTDNSWLTLWATTGVVGVILFALPWACVGVIYVRRWLVDTHGESLAAALGIGMLFVHSQFLNSFLYGHLLITLIIVCALALQTTPRTAP
jgi:hypothetical protein